ncbi:hypothetical protein [Pelagicoccus sp. SDUM812003]|uniref:hypothetical protein n=1 Tax=Pelagicoccus sp. SDUM812003 TaxID=3041267 RepID=UPI00280CE307|nr:hypothetical protein [Pelagicoccus sp. SDUM812003]MDQ8204954.1 hypothetical protein [Pelagicoccus sp. SDUM812003]
MNTKLFKKARALALILALGASVATSANALTFTFSQGGFAEGATFWVPFRERMRMVTDT